MGGTIVIGRLGKDHCPIVGKLEENQFGTGGLVFVYQMEN